MGITSSNDFDSELSPHSRSAYCAPLPKFGKEIRRNTPAGLMPDRSTYLLMSHALSPTTEGKNEAHHVLKGVTKSDQKLSDWNSISKNRRSASAVPQRRATFPSVRDTGNSEPGCFGRRFTSLPIPFLSDSNSNSGARSHACIPLPTRPPPYTRAMSVFSNMFSDLTTRPRQPHAPPRRVSTRTRVSNIPSSKRCKKKVWIKDGVSLVRKHSHDVGSSAAAALDLRQPSSPGLESGQSIPVAPPLCIHPLLMEGKMDACRSYRGDGETRQR